MKITIEIDTDNAAFEGDGCGMEVARILRRLCVLRRLCGDAAIAAMPADDVKPTLDGWPLRDVNGNTCGVVRVSE